MSEPFDAAPELLFVHALELGPAERERWLEELARARPEVADELASLLAAQARMGDFLAEPGAFALRAPADAVPERIGDFRVLGLLGEGGMGVVYLAEQEQPRRTVALKVLPPSLASPSRWARFTREAELLGRLAHRGIARIYAAGVADSGAGPQPYFAMEHVRGRRIDEWLDARGAGTAERVELLAQVCAAVEHAHRQGVVHRDLKPANVLVGEEGEEPEVKVLDFGVARALGGEAAEQGLRTATGQLIGTLAYMSPEQAGGDPEALDARSDVYALGVLAYELIAGRRPYELDGLALLDAVRAIRESEPPPLSLFARVARGDLETIVGKALEKEPRRRYADAGELGADLERWLAGSAVLARPPSRTDLLVRAARRHKALLGGLAAGILSLTAGLVLALWQNALLRVERDRAAEERKNALAVAGWFEALLTRPSPWVGGREVALREVLEQGARSLPEEVRAAPAVEARVRAALGMTFLSLGDLERAEEELALALERALSAHGPEHESCFVLRSRQGHLALMRGRLEEAERLLLEAERGLSRTMGGESREVLVAGDGLARLDQARGRYLEAERRMRGLLRAHERRGVEGRSDALTAASNLAGLLVASGRSAEAIALLEPALAEGRSVEGARHPNTLMKVNNLAIALQQLGRFEEALPLLSELYEGAQEVLGPEHPDALTCRMNLGSALVALDRVDEALPHLRATLEAREELLGPAHDATLTARNNLATACSKAGDHAAAERHYLAILAAYEARDPGSHHAPSARQNLAIARLQLGRAEEACADLEQALEEMSDALGPDHWRVAHVRASLADALRALGMFEEAERELALALPVLERELGPDHPRVRAAAARR